MTVHCLSSGCLNETPETGRLVHFLTVLEVKSLKSRWQHGCFQARMTFWLLEATFQVCALCSGDRERERSGLESGLTRALIPSQGSTLMTSSKPNHLPKALPPNTIPFGVRAST